LKSDQGLHFGKASTVPLDRYRSLVVVTVIIAISVVTIGIVAETARVPRGKLREHPRLEVELELAAYGRTEAVEKLAESRACDVILHITGVEVVSGVKNGQADSRSSSSNPGDELGYGETFCNLQGKRQKCWETSRPVAWADKIQALINEGEREARSNFDQGRDVNIVAHSELAIGEESVRRVKGLWPVLVRPDYERWKIAEKVIDRVKIAPSFGPHVRSV